jgi:hypothetical protein
LTLGQFRLVANRGASHIGSYVLGIGFVLQPEQAEALIDRDSRNEEVLFPYLNGEDLNSRPDCSASRWVINFRDWPIERAQSYPDVFAIIDEKVRPERQRLKPDGSFALRKPLPQRWWQYADKRPALVKAMTNLDRVLVVALVSRTVMPVLAPTRQVFSHMLGVFASDEVGHTALLSSGIHYAWAIARASSLKGDLRYTPSDVYETLPLPTSTHELTSTGRALEAGRSLIMQERQLGLTKLYNLVHDQTNVDGDIRELRKLHEDVDAAVFSAYEWTDLDPVNEFHHTRQGVRHTLGPVVQTEVLDRLLELNHERHGIESSSGISKRAKHSIGDRIAESEGVLF